MTTYITTLRDQWEIFGTIYNLVRKINKDDRIVIIKEDGYIAGYEIFHKLSGMYPRIIWISVDDIQKYIEPSNEIVVNVLTGELIAGHVDNSR